MGPSSLSGNALRITSNFSISQGRTFIINKFDGATSSLPRSNLKIRVVTLATDELLLVPQFSFFSVRITDENISMGVSHAKQPSRDGGSGSGNPGTLAQVPVTQVPVTQVPVTQAA